jgi:hypothetical protein
MPEKKTVLVFEAGHPLIASRRRWEKSGRGGSGFAFSTCIEVEEFWELGCFFSDCHFTNPFCVDNRLHYHLDKQFLLLSRPLSIVSPSSIAQSRNTTGRRGETAVEASRERNRRRRFVFLAPGLVTAKESSIVDSAGVFSDPTLQLEFEVRSRVESDEESIPIVWIMNVLSVRLRSGFEGRRTRPFAKESRTWRGKRGRRRGGHAREKRASRRNRAAKGERDKK